MYELIYRAHMQDCAYWQYIILGNVVFPLITLVKLQPYLLMYSISYVMNNYNNKHCILLRVKKRNNLIQDDDYS